MESRSRKKVVNTENIVNKGEQNALPTFVTREKTLKEKNVADSNIEFKFKKVLFLVLVILLLATGVFFVKIFNFNVVELMWKSNVTVGSELINNKSIRYSSFMNGLMRISNDGITFIDEFGKVKWTVAYNINDPIYVSNDMYFAVADRSSNEFYIFNENGLSGKNTVASIIQKISLSKNGIIYILHSDSNSSYINVFRDNGTIIDLSLKSTLEGDGIPIDISVSSDGTGLIVAYTNIKDNSLSFKTIYYNFDEAGKKNSKKIVKEFIDEFDDKFIARVHYFDNANSFILYDYGAYFISTSNPGKPTISNHLSFDQKIRSISYNYDSLALVFEDNTFKVINKNGTVSANKQFDFEYDDFYISENYIVFLSGNRVMIYDTRGRMIFDKEMNVKVQYVAKKKTLLFTELLVGVIDGVECVRFY